jgi:hypothetical protein
MSDLNCNSSLLHAQKRVINHPAHLDCFSFHIVLLKLCISCQQVATKLLPDHITRLPLVLTTLG